MSDATNFLDNREAIATLDKAGVLPTIEQLASQCTEVWEVASQLVVPTEYATVKQVVVAGMGGSALGTHIIQSVFKDELKVPVLIVPEYNMPAFVGSDSLVIASSYSGTTEETIAAMQDAKQRGAKIAGITSGGRVAELLREWSVPAIIFPTTFNPSKEPRMGLGYSVFGQMILLAKCGLLEITQSHVDDVLDVIAKSHLSYAQSVPSSQNPAKICAFEMLDRIPVITVAEHLEGVAHVFANQLNENSKTFSEYRVIPEMNHHLMEGLRFPNVNQTNILFFIVESSLYSPSNALRCTLSKEVITQNNLQLHTLTLTSNSKLQQAFELLVFGSYVSFYLAMLHNVDPATIPFVDWFKAELKKRNS